MVKSFKLDCQARWADMDFNGHMKNTAFFDYAADSRMMFFKENGFPLSAFSKLKIGPVVFSEEIHYFKELFMYDNFVVKLLAKQRNESGSKFKLVNEFWHEKGHMAALIQTNACWLDLSERKITTPPDDLLAIMDCLEQTKDFKISNQDR